MKPRIYSSSSLKASWVRLPLPKKSLPLLLLLRTIPIRLTCTCPIAIPVNSIHANVFYVRYRSSYRITETADTNVCVWKLVSSAKVISVQRWLQSRNLPSVESNSLHSRNPHAFHLHSMPLHQVWAHLHYLNVQTQCGGTCQMRLVHSSAEQSRAEHSKAQHSKAQHSTAQHTYHNQITFSC